MAMDFTDEEFHQITIEDYYKREVVKPNLFAISRIFAEAHKQMNLKEYKTLALGLSRINWTQPCPDIMYFDKKELAHLLGINSDPDHLSQDLKDEIGEMPKHSFIKFDNKKQNIYLAGNFVRTIAMFKNVVRIKLEEDFLDCFGNLDGKMEVSKYITMWSGDIYGMKSQRSVLFYELLRDNSDTRKAINTGTVGVKKFKELFDIPKEGPGSYMRKKGGFNRSEFEHKVIDPICEDLSKTDMIQLILTTEGKYYEKIKNGNKVIAYKFYWRLCDPKPAIEEKRTAPEEAEVEGEASVSAAKVDERPLYRLWEDELKEFGFSQAQLDAIGTRLYVVPEYMLPELPPSENGIDLRRVHFVERLAADLRVADSQRPVKDKYKYLLRMIENFGRDDK